MREKKRELEEIERLKMIGLKKDRNIKI
jgi:hypothetical protein